ncbi:hypothetical protein ECG_08045 [Echinococcus granulosus]|uniref:Phospholipase A2 active site n=1 Tax=Echinococcus granulosus TaxID=6210 RepID=A0A068WVN7_ECHGR|nr:hypothetical protein ECG_08045 [Echinococcus granulosus]CDS23870.1 Phospholipase A2 active site [Echinococcus granulosus]
MICDFNSLFRDYHCCCRHSECFCPISPCYVSLLFPFSLNFFHRTQAPSTVVIYAHRNTISCLDLCKSLTPYVREQALLPFPLYSPSEN